MDRWKSSHAVRLLAILACLALLAGGCTDDKISKPGEESKSLDTSAKAVTSAKSAAKLAGAAARAAGSIEAKCSGAADDIAKGDIPVLPGGTSAGTRGPSGSTSFRGSGRGRPVITATLISGVVDVATGNFEISFDTEAKSDASIDAPVGETGPSGATITSRPTGSTGTGSSVRPNQVPRAKTDVLRQVGGERFLKINTLRGGGSGGATGIDGALSAITGASGANGDLGALAGLADAAELLSQIALPSGASGAFGPSGPSGSSGASGGPVGGDRWLALGDGSAGPISVQPAIGDIPGAETNGVQFIGTLLGLDKIASGEDITVTYGQLGDDLVVSISAFMEPESATLHRAGSPAMRADFTLDEKGGVVEVLVYGWTQDRNGDGAIESVMAPVRCTLVLADSPVALEVPADAVETRSGR